MRIYALVIIHFSHKPYRFYIRLFVCLHLLPLLGQKLFTSPLLSICSASDVRSKVTPDETAWEHGQSLKYVLCISYSSENRVLAGRPRGLAEGSGVTPWVMRVPATTAPGFEIKRRAAQWALIALSGNKPRPRPAGRLHEARPGPARCVKALGGIPTVSKETTSWHANIISEARPLVL